MNPHMFTCMFANLVTFMFTNKFTFMVTPMFTCMSMHVYKQLKEAIKHMNVILGFGPKCQNPSCPRWAGG